MKRRRLIFRASLPKKVDYRLNVLLLFDGYSLVMLLLYLIRWNVYRILQFILSGGHMESKSDETDGPVPSTESNPTSSPGSLLRVAGRMPSRIPVPVSRTSPSSIRSSSSSSSLHGKSKKTSDCLSPQEWTALDCSTVEVPSPTVSPTSSLMPASRRTPPLTSLTSISLLTSASQGFSSCEPQPAVSSSTTSLPSKPKTAKGRAFFGRCTTIPEERDTIQSIRPVLPPSVVPLSSYLQSNDSTISWDGQYLKLACTKCQKPQEDPESLLKHLYQVCKVPSEFHGSCAGCGRMEGLNGHDAVGKHMRIPCGPVILLDGILFEEKVRAELTTYARRLIFDQARLHGRIN